MIRARAPRGDTSDHYDAHTLLVLDHERVPKYHGELARSEWYVRLLVPAILAGIQTSNALLQCKQ
jgi:hypothetical protein